MIRAKDQLQEEQHYPHLTAFLRSGGTLEVGENFSIGAFARVRKGNHTVILDTAYRDFADILKQMDRLAEKHFEQQQ